MIPFDQICELGSSVLFLIFGLWGTAYGYGIVGGRLWGPVQWNPSFKHHLRWLGPLLIALCVASLLLIGVHSW
jgi:hypothetical protein